MEFYDRVTYFDLAKDRLPEHLQRDRNEFYRVALESALEGALNPTSYQAQFGAFVEKKFDEEAGHYMTEQTYVINAEWDWFKAQFPYYKIWPQWISMFSETKLAVPSEYFQLPFKSLLIRFPKNNILQVDDKHEVRSISLYEVLRNEITGPCSFPEASRFLIMWVDVGEIQQGVPTTNYLQIPFIGPEHIEDAIDRLPPSRGLKHGLQVPDGVMTQCLKISVAVCFLATGADDLVSPDVLTKDVQQYHDPTTDKKTRERLEKKAKKRKKFGWNITTKEILLGKPQKQTNCQPSGTKRGKLQYQHPRGAHFHTFRYGPGKKKVKVIFLRQTTVRPDLQPPPEDHKRGYKTKSK